MQNLMKSTMLASLFAATVGAATPVLADIDATVAGRDMLRDMEIELVTANNRMAAVPASDLSQVTDIIQHLGQDAQVVYDAFYNAPVDTSGVCSRTDIIDTMDDLRATIITYRDRLGSPPADLLAAFNLLSDRMETIEDRLGDALNQAEAGC